MDPVAPTLPRSAVEFARDPALRTALAVSLALHLWLLTLAAVALRPLPASVVASFGAPVPLQAMLVAIPAQEAPSVTERAEPAQQPLPMPPIVVPPRLNSASGLSMRPALVAAEAEFAALGNVAMGIATDPREFGPGVVALLEQRYPYTPARLPRLVGGLQVLYPVKAARAGTSHRLKVLVLLDATGNILELQSAPEDPLFSVAVVNALKNRQFVPADFSAMPVPYWAILDFRFQIDGPTGADGRRLN